MSIRKCLSTAPVLGVLIFSILSLAGCHSGDSVSRVPTEVSAASPKNPETVPESARPAKPGDIAELGPNAPELSQISIEPAKSIVVPSDEIVAPAKVELNPNRVSHAVLPVPGRIVKVMVRLGDSVKEGQPVVTVESPAVSEAESGYRQAENSVQQAELAVAKADADLARLSDLFEHDAVAKKEVLAAQTVAALSKSALEQAENGREQAKRRLELLGLETGKRQQQVTVTAPINGKILEINVVAGEFHNEVNAPIMTIADLSRVWLSSEVPESDIRHCRVGGTAEVEMIAYPGETFRGRVTRIADSVDVTTRTIKVTAEMDNPGGRLRPEMFGRVHYAGEPMASVWVPEAAVVEVAGSPHVFVEQSRGRFQAVPVELGMRHENGFLVIKGIAASQRVVTAGGIYLKAAL